MKSIASLSTYKMINPIIKNSFDFIYANNEELFSQVIDVASFDPYFPFESDEHPRNLMMIPIRTSHDHDEKVVGLLLTAIRWEVFFTNAIHGGIQGLIIVVSNSCGDIFTYEVNGPNARFLGFGDHHSEEYDEPHTWVNFEPFSWHTEEDNNSTVNCH